MSRGAKLNRRGLFGAVAGLAAGGSATAEPSAFHREARQFMARNRDAKTWPLKVWGDTAGFHSVEADGTRMFSSDGVHWTAVS